MPLATPTLDTTRLRMRPVTDDDRDALFALHTNKNVLRYWDGPVWADRTGADRFVASSRKLAEEASGARLMIERRSDGRFIGWCALQQWHPAFRSATIGCCLDAPFWGQGFATEANRALLRWSFETLDLNRIQAETDTRNIASGRALEKLGFVLEGTLRQNCIVEGEISDSWIYGLLRQDWFAKLTEPPAA